MPLNSDPISKVRLLLKKQQIYQFGLYIEILSSYNPHIVKTDYVRL